MNGLEAAVIGIIGISALVGYVTGFLRVIYSLFAWFLVLTFVTWATPHAALFLENELGLKQAIEEKCIDYMEVLAEDKIAGGMEEYQEQKSAEGVLGLLPEDIAKELAESAVETIGETLEESGLYDEIAETVSHYIIQGIAFFALMTIGGILMHWIAHILDLAARIPLIRGPNKILGAVAGVLKGLLIVWLMFYIVALCSTGGIGMSLMNYIEESPFLRFLYANNVLLHLIMIFL